MASRFQDLVTRLIAKDDASKVIEHVADDLQKLEKKGDTEVTITADDKATKELVSLDKRLEGLSDKDKKIVIDTRLAEAQKDVDRLLKSLARVDRMDDEQVKIRVDALGDARKELDKIQKEADRLDRETVEVDVDADTTTISGKFAKLKTDLAEAGTGFDKLKVLGSGAFSALAEAGPFALIGAGTAITTFVTKAVGDFQRLGVEVGKMRDTLGIPAEAASRLAEVAGDIGVPIDALTTAISKMNRTVATSPDAFDAMNASIVRSDDGATDVMGTFLEVIDALNGIPDAAQRAAAGQKVFGKGWGQISELIMEGAAGVKQAMADVSDQKVISDDEIEKARKMRDQMDDLHDQLENVSITAGEALLPAFQDLAKAAADILGPVSKTIEILDKFRQDEGRDDESSWRHNLSVFFTQSLPGQIEHVGGLVGQLKGQLKDTFGGGVEGTFDTSAVESYNQELIRSGLAADKAAISMKEFAEANRNVTDPQIARNAAEHADMMFLEAQQAQDTANDMEVLRRQLEAKQRADERAKQAVQDHIDALQEEADLAAETSGAMQSMADINREIADQQREVNKLAKDEKATTDDRVDAAIRLAELQEQQFDTLKKAAGATATATEKLDAQNRALLGQAAILKGDARTQLLQYIADLNGIPKDKLTNIQTLLDQGKFDEAERKIQRLSENRKATVTFDADTKEADDARERLAEPITTEMLIFPRVGGPIPRFAGGGYVPRNTVALVGERGPEIVALPGGSRVSSTAQTNRMLSTTSTTAQRPVVYNVTQVFQTGVMGAPFDVSRAVEDANRRTLRLMPKVP